MRETRRSAARGFLLGYVMVVAAILSVVAMLLLESAETAAIDARQVEVKNQSFNAAEAGLNAALDALDKSLGVSASRSETLADGYHYTYYIHPNFNGSVSQVIDDPGEGSEGGDHNGGMGQGGNQAKDKVNIPAGGAVIVVVGTGPNGERSTTLEAAVTLDVTQLSYPMYAIVSGLNMQGAYASVLSASGASGGDLVLHANGSITARTTQAYKGRAEASGSTNTLPPGITRASQVPLPMVSQFDYMVASYKNQAMAYLGASNVYVQSGGQLQPIYSCPIAQSQGCLLFYDGSLTMTTQQTTLNGPWTMVVNGDLCMGSGGALRFQNRPSLLIVNGNAKILNASLISAYLEVKGSTTLSGSAAITGAILTLGTLTFSDGSGGGFTYDPTVIPPEHAMTGLVKIISYAEY
jgi:hypothetical protein